MARLCLALLYLIAFVSYKASPTQGHPHHSLRFQIVNFTTTWRGDPGLWDNKAPSGPDVALQMSLANETNEFVFGSSSDDVGELDVSRVDRVVPPSYALPNQVIRTDLAPFEKFLVVDVEQSGNPMLMLAASASDALVTCATHRGDNMFECTFTDVRFVKASPVDVTVSLVFTLTCGGTSGGTCSSPSSACTSLNTCQCTEGYISPSGNGLDCVHECSVCDSTTEACVDGECFKKCEAGGTYCPGAGQACVDSQCMCGNGYEYNSTLEDCIDVDECALDALPCGEFGTCTNTLGSFECICDVGYQVSAELGACEDIDECAANSTICSDHGTCNNTGGSYTCACHDGFEYDPIAKLCVDVDECARNATLCVAVGTCHNTQGSFECHCASGFELSPESGSCKDINECATDAAICGDHGTCNNTVGTYECTCDDGFEYDATSKQCLDIDECIREVAQCIDHSHCINTVGTYVCVCDDGYAPDINTGVCEDVDECEANATICGVFGVCHNTLGAYTCTCDAGFELNSEHSACQDVDECHGGLAACPDHSHCNNTVGTYVCICEDGYTNSTSTGLCEDVDECTVNPTVCGSNSKCNNTVGSYDCICDAGYSHSVSPQTCTDIDECSSEAPPCGGNGKCYNTDGSFYCRCLSGFGYNATLQLCTDIDECKATPGLCGEHGLCTNQIGSHNCSCMSGFRWNDTVSQCVDVDECLEAANADSALCPVEAICTNTLGAYTCTCGASFVLVDGMCVSTHFNLTESERGELQHVPIGDPKGVLINPPAVLFADTQCVSSAEAECEVRCSDWSVLQSYAQRGYVGQFSYTCTVRKPLVVRLVLPVVIVDITKPRITLRGNATLTLMTGNIHDAVDPGVIVSDTSSTGAQVTSDWARVVQAVQLRQVTSITVTYVATDRSNNTATVSRQVHIVDVTKPAVFLIGSSRLQWERYTPFVDPGVYVVDNGFPIDGSEVGTDGLVDVNVEGEYTLTYSVADESGNVAEATRRVQVLDTTAPSIQLRLAGHDSAAYSHSIQTTLDASVGCVQSMKDLVEVLAFDVFPSGGMRSYVNDSLVAVPSHIDCSKVGTTTVLFTVTDDSSQKNTAVAPCIVRVVDVTAPTFLLNEPSQPIGKVVVEFGTVPSVSQLVQGLTAFDALDGDVTASATAVLGSFDPFVIGEQSVQVQVSDASKNRAPLLTRTVVVVAPSDPDVILTLQFKAEAGADATEVASKLSLTRSQHLFLHSFSRASPESSGGDVVVVSVFDSAVGRLLVAGELELRGTDATLLRSSPDSGQSTTTASISVITVIVPVVALLVGVIFIVLAVRWHRRHRRGSSTVLSHGMEFTRQHHDASSAVDAYAEPDMMLAQTRVHGSSSVYASVASPTVGTGKERRPSEYIPLASQPVLGGDVPLYQTTHDSSSEPIGRIEVIKPDGTPTTLGDKPVYVAVADQTPSAVMYQTASEVLPVAHEAPSKYKNAVVFGPSHAETVLSQCNVGAISRDVAIEMLTPTLPGTFLVRTNDRLDASFVVSVRLESGFIHHKVDISEAGALVNSRLIPGLTSPAEILDHLMTSDTLDVGRPQLPISHVTS
eukprot:m.64579 g.64579  ORF g.64579 m.64579 type:complete len:1574 (-) comp12017_c5_seq1:432-5153(-)